MSPAEAFGSASSSLLAHKLRSSLTMLGMVFGVGAVIAMLSIGAGAESEARVMLDRLGLRNILIRARPLQKEELMEARKASIGVSPRDREAIAEAIPGIELTAARIDLDPWQVMARGHRTAAKVYGAQPVQAKLVDLTVSEGRFIDRDDATTHAQVCVIGSAVRRDLFGGDPAIGGHVKVDDLWCEVIGVLVGSAGGATSFQGVFVGSSEREIYLPLSTVSRKLERPPLSSPFDEIIVELKPGVDSASTAVVLAALLDRLHGGSADYEIVVPAALWEQSRRTQRLFNTVMGCIAGISLLVGGIGIMNIMLATVLERTREIGLRRALGARRRDIRRQFLIEAFTISLVGGLVGIVLGVVIAHGVARGAGWTTVVTTGSILLASGVSMAVGLVSGIYPALNAARLDPIEALRYE